MHSWRWKQEAYGHAAQDRGRGCGPPCHRVFFGNISALTSEAEFIDTVPATAGPITHLKRNMAQPSLGLSSNAQHCFDIFKAVCICVLFVSQYHSHCSSLLGGDRSYIVTFKTKDAADWAKMDITSWQKPWMVETGHSSCVCVLRVCVCVS